MSLFSNTTRQVRLAFEARYRLDTWVMESKHETKTKYAWVSSWRYCSALTIGSFLYFRSAKHTNGGEAKKIIWMESPSKPLLHLVSTNSTFLTRRVTAVRVTASQPNCLLQKGETLSLPSWLMITMLMTRITLDWVSQTRRTHVYLASTWPWKPLVVSCASCSSSYSLALRKLQSALTHSLWIHWNDSAKCAATLCRKVTIYELW